MLYVQLIVSLKLLSQSFAPTVLLAASVSCAIHLVILLALTISSIGLLNRGREEQRTK